MRQEGVVCIILLTMLRLGLFAQSCPDTTVVIQSQLELSDFISSYPDCTELETNLIIKDSDDILSLEGLDIEHVAGNLHLINLSSLNDLEGLSNLKTIALDFKIDNCTKLEDLKDLISLEKVGGDFVIQNNNGLQRLTKMEALTEVHNLEIGNNKEIGIIDGFNSLQELHAVHISGNENLSIIEGFSSLEEIVSDLIIEDNPFLSVVAAFDNLETAGGSIKFQRSDILFSIANFSKVKSIDGSLVFSDCNTLEKLSVFENLEYIGDNLSILNTGIRHIDFFKSLKEVADRMQIFNNLELASIADFAMVEEIGGSLHMISNPNLKTINGFENLEQVGGSLILSGLDSLANLPNFNSLVYIDQWLDVERTSTTNLDVFENLKEVKNIELMNNKYLHCVKGLRNVESELRNLEIIGNDSLLTLEPMSNIVLDNHFSTKLFIENNENLSHCAIPGICSILSEPLIHVTIGDNIGNCANRSAVIDHCSTLTNTSEPEIISDLNLVSNLVTNELIFTHRWEGNFSILSSNGLELKKAHSDFQKSLDVSSLLPGLYFLVFIQDEGYRSVPFLKN